MGERFSVLNAALRGAACSLALAACAGPAPMDGLNGPSETDLIRLASLTAPPVLSANDARNVAEAAAGAATVSAERFSALSDSRMVEISAIPWLRASPEGERFLASSFPRALARGFPPQSCPAAAASKPSADSRSSAAASALVSCLDVLTRRGAAEDCGCRIVAVDDALLAPRDEFSFAPVVSALMIGPDGARRLVAESLAPVQGAELVSLRDPAGEVARIALLDDAAELILVGGAQYSGVRKPFGYRRGRLAERLVLTGPSGSEMTILLGVESRDAFRS